MKWLGLGKLTLSSSDGLPHNNNDISLTTTPIRDDECLATTSGNDAQPSWGCRVDSRQVVESLMNKRTSGLD